MQRYIRLPDNVRDEMGLFSSLTLSYKWQAEIVVMVANSHARVDKVTIRLVGTWEESDRSW